MSRLIIRHLRADYDNFPALEDVSLSLGSGQTAAIIGPSGCGKSTFLKAVAGLIKFRGEILLDDAPLTPRGQKIGFMPQDYGLLPWRTVRENILLPQRLKRVKENIDPVRYEYFLTKLGLTHLAERYPRELSGGERQRVGLARTFLLEPDILLMDEPFSALDAITRENMQEIFLALWRENAVTTLLVTHYVEEALYLGQQIIIMSWGGKIEEIIENPAFAADGREVDSDFSVLGRQLKKRIKQMGARS